MQMATLEDLLVAEGFQEMKHKKKTVSKEGSSKTSASRIPSPRFGSSSPKILPVRSNSDVNLQISVPVVPEKSGFIDLTTSNAEGRNCEEQLLDPRESIVLTSPKKYKERGGRTSKKLLDVKFTSRKFWESKDGCYEGIEGKWRCYKNDLYDHAQKSSENQNFQERPALEDAKDGCDLPTLDETELKKIMSVINNCVDQLLKDKTFRSTVHRDCISSLNASEVESKHAKDNDVLSTLKEAIGSVERMVTEGPNQLELKKTFLKLSVITGLKTLESVDGFTSGIPNSHLVGCAHLHLSILYKMQNKVKVSAKHLLQVFHYSSNHARTKLLPEVWRCLFLPQLSHLKEWYDKEALSIQGTSEMMTKMEILDRVYNDLLDGGTSQFAAYYKSWLMDENRTPALPSILFPLPSVLEVTGDANEVILAEPHRKSTSVISKSMISKVLYESVLGQENKAKTEETMVSGEDEVEVENELGQSVVWRSRHDDYKLKDNEAGSSSPNSGIHVEESNNEYYSAGSQDQIVFFEENSKADDNSSRSSSPSIIGVKEIRADSQIVQPWGNIEDCIHVGKADIHEYDSKPKMQKLDQYASQMQAISDSSDADTSYPHQSVDYPLYDSYQHELTEVTQSESLNDETYGSHRLSSLCSLQASASTVPFGYRENYDQDSTTGFPKCFICPLKGLILKEPVTLETGYTFELAAIKKRFDQGIKTCPVTGQLLKYSTIPGPNIVFKHLINEWVAECFRNSPFSAVKQVFNSRSELAFLIFEQMLAGLNSDEKKENIKHLIALGGLQFLTQMLELGCLEVKSRAAEFLVQCIKADGCYRKYLVMNIRKSSLLELIHSWQIHEKINAASLLIELICLDRRMDITSFLSGLKTEASFTIMSDLLLCLKSSLPEERVLVAVLLLHLDLMEESQIYSTFSGEAVKCIMAALQCCLSNNKFIPNCRAALFMLGGYFSSSGEILLEIWLLKQAGFDGYSLGHDDVGDETISEEEEIRRKDWLKSVTSILIRYKKKSFFETLSTCWKFGSPDLASICLVTTAWLSLALPSLCLPALQFSATSALLPRLKESFRSDLDIRQRVLACLCLFNFSKISECRDSLKEIVVEIHDPLNNLRGVTWTAERLYKDFFDKNYDFH
ncbi:putative E3 ubiquitin-protein ligase LIN [Platanthera zijinensis]|uniref:RING-type E3 ubiquitin transferase n=1 Tax=Platanthera zijinensis TaxID=2320716 RepID=A0AAP0BD64_9ASPA